MDIKHVKGIEVDWSETVVVQDKKRHKCEAVFFCPCLDEYTTLAACEHFCDAYYRCNFVADADNDICAYEGCYEEKSCFQGVTEYSSPLYRYED